MPKFSIVVPSLNQGRFIAESLESILRQNEQELELFVLDAGSTDETLDIIWRYSGGITFWRSHPDKGQAAAINEGFARATGQIFCWLNSDDVYAPGAFSIVANAIAPYLQEPVICYGGCELFREGPPWREVRSAVSFDQRLLQTTDCFDQPSVFWTRKAWQLVGPLDEALHYAFDWDWFLRAANCCRFIRVGATISRYRVHAAHKSGTGGDKRWRELLEVVRRHSPPEIVRHYEFLDDHPIAHWWLNKRMRLKQTIGRAWPDASDFMADLFSPPFWRLPPNVSKKVLWEISGIR